jgi:ABC-type phosphate transport system permease subunit
MSIRQQHQEHGVYLGRIVFSMRFRRALRDLPPIITTGLARIIKRSAKMITTAASFLLGILERLIFRMPSRSWGELFFYLIILPLTLLLGLILIELVLYVIQSPVDAIQSNIASLTNVLSPELLLQFLIGAVIFWFVLRLLASQSLMVLRLKGRLRAGWFFNSASKLLASLPTIVLGSTVIGLTNTLGLQPVNETLQVVYMFSVYTIIGLPTVLQIGYASLEEVEQKKIEDALAQGFPDRYLISNVLWPSVRRSFNVAVTVAMSRIIVEGYIVIDRTLVAQSASTTLIEDSKAFLDIFNTIYSTMSVQTNPILILILFLIGLFTNIGFTGLMAKP